MSQWSRSTSTGMYLSEMYKYYPWGSFAPCKDYLRTHVCTDTASAWEGNDCVAPKKEREKYHNN